jgi:hypothetical protein
MPLGFFFFPTTMDFLAAGVETRARGDAFAPEFPLYFARTRATTFIGFPHFGHSNGPSSEATLAKKRAVVAKTLFFHSQLSVTHFTFVITASP